jgi:phage terminase large subunit
VAKYTPRHQFTPFHARRNRWFMLVAHRRAGKTVAAINDLISKACYNVREAPRYGYIAPFLKQAKQIAWDYLKRFSAPYSPKINESELWVELTSLPNSPRITIYGADNPDSFRGLYFDGVVLDEFGNMRLSIWKEILLPALIDRRGWAVFMGTPNGPNHFRDMWYEADNKESYGKLFLPVSLTKIIPDEELALLREEMDEEEYAQEMECSFEASVRGAIYARQMEKVQQEGRIGNFPLQKGLPVHVVMDLGWRDDTTMGFYQERPDGIVIGHAHHNSLQPISVYIKHYNDFFTRTGLKPGKIWLPHDAKAKSLQTGKSIIENFRSSSLRPSLVPELDLLDGIAAARKTFPLIYFNEPETKDLVLALKSYHRKYDEDRKVFLNEPVHDWSSHYADKFRYLCIVANSKAIIKQEDDRPRTLAPEGGHGVHYGFALNDIWDLGPQRSNRL